MARTVFIKKYSILWNSNATYRPFSIISSTDTSIFHTYSLNYAYFTSKFLAAWNFDCIQLLEWVLKFLGFFEFNTSAIYQS